ncbi:MAG: glycosyltransferase family 39 protein [Thermoanaerobaculia bacterium]
MSAGKEAAPQRGATAVLLALAAVKLVAHLANAARYGIFRDELYYLACAEHLDWGYVDQPPLIAGIAWVARRLFGESLYGLRFLPALAGAAKVVLAGLLARALGGGRFSQAIAALAVLAAPIYLGIDHLLTMNAFEPLFWMGGALAAIRWTRTGDDRLWIWFGALLGLGLLNKQTTFVFGFAMLAGLLVTPARAALRLRGFWIGGGVAFAIFLPNLVWMARHGFPMLELLGNIRASGRNVSLDPLAFLGQQVLFLLPLSAPLWIAGLAWLLAAREARPYRFLGWAFVVLELTLFLTGGRVYYAAAFFPLLFAAGGVALERVLSVRRRLAWLGPAYAALVAAAGVVFAPLTLPVLSQDAYIRYAARLGIEQPRIETHEMGRLPQIYADMHGWEEMAQAVARVYRALPEEARRHTAIVGNNYGESGAIDFFGPGLGLPRAIGVHQSYWLWGPGETRPEVLIVLGEGDRAALESKCASVEEVARLDHPYAMPYENRPIYLCRGPKGDLREIWPLLKSWN